MNEHSLSRRVRALTATTFGSYDAGLNKLGSGLELPNTNQHAVQGSNPIWSTTESDGKPRGIPDFDAESVGSGGSVLIGVEDDDDFRNYKENPGSRGQDSNFHFNNPSGTSNPMFEGEDNDEMNEEDDGFDFLEGQSNNENSDDGDPPMSNVSRRNPLARMESIDA